MPQISVRKAYLQYIPLLQNKIEENYGSIGYSTKAPGNVRYYYKFHCELNHIEYFWCDV